MQLQPSGGAWQLQGNGGYWGGLPARQCTQGFHEAKKHVWVRLKMKWRVKLKMKWLAGFTSTPEFVDRNEGNTITKIERRQPVCKSSYYSPCTSSSSSPICMYILLHYNEYILHIRWINTPTSHTNPHLIAGCSIKTFVLPLAKQPKFH